MMWTDFLRETIGQKACPIFCQYVSNEVMKLVIKAEFQIDTSCHGLERSVATLDFEEKNALHYTAGYVIHAVIKDLKRSNDSNKHALISCLEKV